MNVHLSIVTFKKWKKTIKKQRDWRFFESELKQEEVFEQARDEIGKNH